MEIVRGCIKMGDELCISESVYFGEKNMGLIWVEKRTHITCTCMVGVWKEIGGRSAVLLKRNPFVVSEMKIARRVSHHLTL